MSLKVDNLKVWYRTLRGDVQALDGVTFHVADGELVGLAGESGCGKSTMAAAVLRLLPNGTKTSGTVLLEGEDVLTMRPGRLRAVRWTEAAVVFQGAMHALNPVRRVGDQIAEAIHLHDKVSDKRAATRVGELLELSGKRVCILGCGDVGREIAKRLRAFGCHITGVNRTVRVLPDFDEVLPLDKLAETAAACDILVCCIALTPETRGIVSEKIFGRLHDGAVFVNVARGALADEAALTKWLQNGGCAVLDVFEEELLPESSPLWDMENVLLTPHNSFVGDGNRARLWEKIKENLR